MNKTLYIATAFFTATFLFSCKSKKMNLKSGAVIAYANGDKTSQYPSNNVTKTDRGIMMTFDSDLLFPINSSYLTAKAKIALSDFVKLANEHPNSSIMVDGHTDATGTADYNQWLSEKRALSVKAHLKELGVSESRISTKGYGQSQPTATNSTSEGRQQNRRVEITILD